MSSSSSNNNSRSSSVQASHESKCKLAFRITKKKDGGAVYFKQDGTRFATEQTLKLQTATEYAVKLEVSPALELESVKFAGVEYQFKCLTENDNELKKVYQITWATHGIDPTLSHHRADVPCSIKFKSYTDLSFKLQVKFYSLKDAKHAVWGQTLNSLTLEGSVGRGSYNSNVDTFKFL